MNLNLANKRALVCGSSQGIGKAIAISLANEGVNITLMTRNEEKLTKVIEELPNSEKHDYIVSDFKNPDTLKNNLELYLSKNKGFHIIINNTGGPNVGELNQDSTNKLLEAFNMHIICNQIIMQANLEFMKKERFGRIINIISTSVKEPLDNLGSSNTIRGAVGNWSKTLANELGQFGITVNNILPGFTDTKRLNDIIEGIADSNNTTKEIIKENMKNSVPSKRFALAEETANAVTFLASEKANYINGINLPVDGGRTKSL